MWDPGNLRTVICWQPQDNSLRRQRYTTARSAPAPVPGSFPPRHYVWLVIVIIALSLFCFSLIEREPTVAKTLSPLLVLNAQGPDLDYSNFKHTSGRHAALGCTSCHSRAGESGGTPRFPGHKACIDCHSNQFLTPNVPMCSICHTDVNSGNPPLKGFPTKFRESFNAKFDHSQHNVGGGRPPNGCTDCHSRLGGRTTGQSIPVGISAHNQCYTCHTPSSKSSAGREIASCGVCHRVGGYSRTSTSARAFRLAFSHAKHGGAQKLSCADCHRLTPGLPQGRQVSAPAPTQHFPANRGLTCLTCHNGKQSFGGEATFKDCKRCHTAASFRMPM